jgi:hypothetical protein
MHAIGLELRDLFVRRAADRKRAQHLELLPWQAGHQVRTDRLPWADALRLIRFEALVVRICASHIVNGDPITSVDLERVAAAGAKIEAVCGGARV